MTSRLSFALLNLFAVFVASTLVPIARADQWNKETVMTFNNPVEVPGKVLPAGTYVFKIVGSQSDRQVVQIFTQDQRNVLATIQAVPDYRPNPTDKSLISFNEGPSGRPEALRSWFYPGENYGVHFVYPKSTRDQTERGDAQLAANPTPTMPPPLSESIAPLVSQLTSPPVLPVLAKQDREPEVLAENFGTQPMQASVSALPKTAGNYLILPMLGLLLIGGGSAILGKIRRTSSQASNS